MPHNAKTLRSLCTAAICLTALLAAGFLYAALAFAYDPVIRHFETDSTLALLAVIFCLIGAACAVALALVVQLSHEKDLLPNSSGSLSIFSAALLGFLLIVSFIFSIRSLTDPTADWLERIRLALMGLSAVYFLCTMQRSALSPALSLFSLCPILYAFLSVMCVYFDDSYAMNAPVKTYQLMMYLAMALFFTAETRMALGRFKLTSYCLFAGLCIAICGAVGGAQLVVSLTGANGIVFSLTESAAAVSAALFAAARLFSLRTVDSTLPEVSHEQA